MRGIGDYGERQLPPGRDIPERQAAGSCRLPPPHHPASKGTHGEDQRAPMSACGRAGSPPDTGLAKLYSNDPVEPVAGHPGGGATGTADFLRRNCLGRLRGSWDVAGPDRAF